MAIASIYIGYKHFTEHVPFSDVTFPLNPKLLVCEDCSMQFPNHPLNLLTMIFLFPLTGGLGVIWYLFARRKQACPNCTSEKNHVLRPISREEALNMVKNTKMSRGIAPFIVQHYARHGHIIGMLAGIGVTLLGLFMALLGPMHVSGLYVFFCGVGMLYLNERLKKEIEAMYGHY